MGPGRDFFKNLLKRTKINKKNISKGHLVRNPKKTPKGSKDNEWVDLTYKSKEIIPHIKNEQRGKRVVTKTTYHGVRNPEGLSKRKLKKEFAKEPTSNVNVGTIGKKHGSVVPHAGNKYQTHITQKTKTKFKDSRRWNDEVQDRKKKEIKHSTGYTLADQHVDRDYKGKTTYRSKSKHLRANKEGKEIVKKWMADDGIEGVKNVRIRGKAQRESSWKEGCYDDCGVNFKGSIGNKPLKSTKVFKFEKGTQASEAFKKSDEGNPKMMSDIIPGTVKTIRRKEYGDVADRSSNFSKTGKWDKQAKQFKSNKGKVSKLKVRTYEGETYKFKQNVFNKPDSEIAFSELESGEKSKSESQWITKKEFREAKKYDRQTGGSEWSRYKKTGIPDHEHKRIYIAKQH